jgi:hypothetical protein
MPGTRARLLSTARRLTGTPHLKVLSTLPILQSFQKHLGEIADVSLTLETFPFCKYPSPLDSLRNRTQEADGSIPFISTIFIRFFGFFFRMRSGFFVSRIDRRRDGCRWQRARLAVLSTATP